ncbi:MAG: hypothetical protein SGJ00_14055 [bacterium]|nr:hypothetical protein [bacterium]
MENTNKVNRQFGSQITFSDLGLRDKSEILFSKLISGLIDFAKYSYLALVLILILISIIELKHVFQIDLFPGIDTPIDNAYFEGKDQVSNNFL